MSLEGTLETIALPDVLALLSVTSKTGELRVESGGGVGSVWFDAGRLAGYDVGTNSTPLDALFTLLRLKEGGFKFHTGTEPAHSMEPADVAPLLEETEGRLAQWPEIAAVVPSLQSELELKPGVDGTVTLNPEQWQLVVAIGSGNTVGNVIAARGLGEFNGSQAVKELVDLHLVDVVDGEGPAEVPLRAADEAEPAPEGHDAPADLAEPLSVPDEWAHETAPAAEVADLSGVWHEHTGEPVPVANGQHPGAETEPEPDEVAPEPVNRGLLLKFLGSARN